ncbi:hypothetical protein [Brevibacterium salitolerans]|uniref:Uncharacterized protein n=1 Tax=Brevibacterium salitolerans TaxID=1403566 RepID=A0ABN2W947_9MICO
MTPACHPALPPVLTAAEARSRGLHLLEGKGRAGGWATEGAAAPSRSGRAVGGAHASGAEAGSAEARLVHHPMWAVRFDVERGPRGLERLLCLVDAVSTTAHMVAEPQLAAAVLDAVRRGEEGLVDASGAPGAASPHRPPTVSAEDAMEAARAVAGAAMRKRAKLAFLFSLRPAARPALVLKPNWLVRAQGSAAEAEFLLDGLDGSHYVIAFRRRAGRDPE